MPIKSLHSPMYQHFQNDEYRSGNSIATSRRQIILNSMIEDMVRQFRLIGMDDKVKDLFENISSSDKLEELSYNPKLDYTPQVRDRVLTHQLDVAVGGLSKHSIKLFFDLDETLVHATRTGNRLFVRPMTRLLIQILGNMPGVDLIVWSAGAGGHVANALDIIDPDGLIKVAICRDPDYRHDADPKWSNQQLKIDGFNKSFQLLPAEVRASSIIFDNTADEITDTNGQAILAPHFILSDENTRLKLAEDRFIFQVIHFATGIKTMVLESPEYLSNIGGLLKSLRDSRYLVPESQGLVPFQASRQIFGINTGVLSKFSMRELIDTVSKFTRPQYTSQFNPVSRDRHERRIDVFDEHFEEPKYSRPKPMIKAS